MKGMKLRHFFSRIKSAAKTVLYFFGIGRRDEPISPLLFSASEEAGKQITIREGKRRKLYDEICDESVYSVENILQSPERIIKMGAGLNNEEVKQALNEHIIYLKEQKDQKQINETRVFRRRLLLVVALGAVAATFAVMPNNKTS
jgi:hypothetical protein